ncbi:MAG TPA: SH3 domain-containing protein [Herpetosiphonaceae bacterium]
MTTRRARREAARGRDEMLGMLVSCIGCAAILAFISPQLLQGTLGAMLGAGAVLSIVFAIFFHLRHGGSAAGALVLVLFSVSITAGSMFGLWWYLFVYVASQPGLFTFGALAQSPAPQPTSATTLSAPGFSSDLAEAGPAVAPSIAPVPGSTCGSAVVKEVEALALRAEPTRSSQQLAAIARGNRVDILCTASVQADDREWYNVRSGSVEGWMSARYLDVQQP